MGNSGVDIVNHWDLGYEFFNDKDRFLASYIESDILSPNEELSRLNGQMNVIFIAMSCISGIGKRRSWRAKSW